MTESPEAESQRDVPAPPEMAVPSSPAPQPPREPVRRVFPVAAWIAIVALALTAWQWYENRVERHDLKQDLAKKLADTDTQNKESRLVAEQVREAVAEAQVKLGVLEARLAESQNQQIALEALYQELSRNRDE